MADAKRRLTPQQVHEAGLSDWRQVVGVLRARFKTGDFATGLALVQRIGEAAEEADHHPDVTLTYPEVLVTLSSHDVGGITSRDLDLAGRISGFAAEAGLTADPGGVTLVELGLDTDDGASLLPFYTALLGGEERNGEPVDSSGQAPTVWFQGADEDGVALPEPAVPQRWHLDVWVGIDEGPARVQAVLDAGGRLVSDAEAPSYWVLEDADGNRACVCTPADRA